MQVDESIRRCVVFLYAGSGDERRPVGTGFFVSLVVPGRSPTYRYLVTAKHIVEGVHRNGQRLYARVNIRGPLELMLNGQALIEFKRLEEAGETPDFLRLLEDLRAKPPAHFVRNAEEMERRDPASARGTQFVDLGEADKWTFHEDPNVDAAVLDWQPPIDLDFWPIPLEWAEIGRASC